MAMSKDNYAAIANILDDNRTDPMVEARDVATVARELADFFKKNTPRFRYDYFFKACGLDEWGEVK